MDINTYTMHITAGSPSKISGTHRHASLSSTTITPRFTSWPLVSRPDTFSLKSWGDRIANPRWIMARILSDVPFRATLRCFAVRPDHALSLIVAWHECNPCRLWLMFWWQLNAAGKERFGHQENQPVAYQAGERARGGTPDLQRGGRWRRTRVFGLARGQLEIRKEEGTLCVRTSASKRPTIVEMPLGILDFSDWMNWLFFHVLAEQIF
ncbi:hypothetical protein P885DRAFT_56611 [Corynascus similis CBS 632.67]